MLLSVARADEFSSDLDEFTLDIPCFAPTKITFNYAYTHNHSIYDISTFGSSLYTHSGGPNFMEFIAQDIDEYHFTLELDYYDPTNQTILVGLWSGSLPMQGWNFKAIYKHVILYVRLRVQKEPSYPTEAEVAQQVVVEVQKNLESFYKAIENLVASQNTALLTVSIIAVVAVVLSLVTPILLYNTVLKRVRG
jgi:hypothetical protein